jgi:hypothetical protein
MTVAGPRKASRPVTRLPEPVEAVFNDNFSAGKVDRVTIAAERFTGTVHLDRTMPVPLNQ